MHIRRRMRWPLAAALCIILVLALAPAVWAGDGAAAVTAEDARAEASRLITRVNRETGRNPRSGSAEPGWEGARTGEPLLLHSFDGKPKSYLFPVLGDDGGAESVITVDASTGEWCSYGDVTEGRFPLVDSGEAAARVKAFLSERGIEASLGSPQARTAPDKNVYWFFELGGRSALREVYLPVFLKESPTTNLDPLPWKKKRSSTAPAPASGGSAVASVPAFTATYPGGAPPAYDIPDVPHYYQDTSYWCGPASLEMLFDYWGEDIPQREIADVVNADYYGSAYNIDLVRAAHFSNQSTAVADPWLRGYSARPLGYGSADAYWNDSSLFSRRYSDLKELVSQNYPVLILTYYDSPPSSGHFRLVKGYNDSLGTFIVHDPWYTPPYQGPNVNFNQSFLVDTLWPYSNRWGMIAAPWEVTVSKPSSVSAGQVFNVTASVFYRGPSPLAGQYPCTTNSPTATFQTSGDYQLLSGAVNQVIPGIGATGSSGSVSWTVKALSSQSTGNIQIVGQGLIDGTSYTYSSYSDWIGGIGTGASGPQPTSRTWGHDSVGVPAGSTNWYLAEGSTNGGFETWVLVQNPGGSDAHVQLTYMTPSGPVAGPTATLPANSRKTFFVADRVPGQWSVSTKVASDVPVIAERAMYGPGRQWGHDSVAVPAASNTWYLAEGSTAGGFETWVVVQNPNVDAANVTLTYMTPGGPVAGPTFNVGANSRKTLFVADTVPNEWSVSTKVTANMPVIAERAMYGGGRTWGHDSAGVTTAASAWYLAEGCTNGGFETWVVVQNPSGSAANVTLTYMTTDGEVPGPSFSLPANSRRTVNVADVVPNTWEVSTRVTANRPVIAERAMYGGGRKWGHDSAGVSTPSSDWYLAEGCTQTGFETWVLVQNPNDYDVDVQLTYMTTAGAVPGPSATLAANSRTTFNVADTIPFEWEVSTHVRSTGGGVIAERSMYGDPN
jgi:Peptidase_C39 like family/Family of unknown function (DUF5719)